MDFVGITWDSDQMKTRLPLVKIAKCHSLIYEFLKKRSKKRKMQCHSLTGEFLKRKSCIAFSFCSNPFILCYYSCMYVMN